MDDSFNRNLVIIIFIVAYFYMNFMSIQIRSRSGWNNLTCNPMKLFSNSLFQTQEDANRDFERCIVNLSSATTTNLFKKQSEEQQNVLAGLSVIENEYTDLTDNVRNYVTDVSNITTEYTNQINTLTQSQENANELNATASNNVRNFMFNLDDMFNNISEFFKNN
jgi:hypothetical protein